MSLPAHFTPIKICGLTREQDVDAAVQAGVQAITIVPMFLGVGKHAREDLPVLVSDLTAAHPEVRFTLQAAVGEHPEVVDVLARLAVAV